MALENKSMRRTTTRNLMSVISSKAARVDNVIFRYSSNEPDTEKIEPAKIIESLEYLNESGIFADAVDWKYEIINVPDGENYILVRGGRMASFMACTIDFQLRACGDVRLSDLEKMLRETIFSQLSA